MIDLCIYLLYIYQLLAELFGWSVKNNRNFEACKKASFPKYFPPRKESNAANISKAIFGVFSFELPTIFFPENRDPGGDFDYNYSPKD